MSKRWIIACFILVTLALAPTLRQTEKINASAEEVKSWWQIMSLGTHFTATTAVSGADVARTDWRPTGITVTSGSVIYVDQDATGAEDGTSWANAYTDLQDALNAATYGDEIWVAEGVYTPAQLLRDVAFQLKSGVELYGGFSGTETARDQRDWEIYVTVLSGDIDDNDITNADGVVTDPDNIQGNNAYHVITSSQVTETTVLDGFTVTAGNAWDNEEDDGGGMHNDSGDPTLINVTFSGNLARRGGGMHNANGSDPTLIGVTFSGNDAYDDGGGMYNYDSDPTLTGVTFSGNEATDDGGGMYNNDSNPTLRDVTFSGNHTSDDGGGMYNRNGSDPALSHVTFSGNRARGFGGGMLNEGSSPTLTHVIFSDNQATGDGGGMENYDYSNPILTDVTFTGNVTLQCGGGVSNFQNSNPTLVDVTFSGNRASSSGGGVWNGGGCDSRLTNVIFSGNEARFADGGGMYNQEDIVLTNVIFSGNYADEDGGGLANWQADDPELTNVTFGGNYAGGSGGGMYNLGSVPTLANCVLWNNGDSGGTDRSAQIHDAYGSDTTVSYSLVQGGYPGTGNLDSDPQFVVPIAHTAAPTTTGDLRLLSTSPAIDAGDNTAVPIDVVTDLGGNLRFVDIPNVTDTGNGAPPIVDMGAYEVQADLAIAKSVLPTATVLPGQTITYAVAFSNTGTYTATGVVITDHVPITLTSVRVISSGVSITDANASPAYVWYVQDLNPGKGGVITLTSVVSSGLTMDTCFSNTATIAPDANATGNTSTVLVTVTLPRLDFSRAMYDVAENSSAVSITVVLNPPALVAVTVDYATSDGSATAGDDYTAVSDTLTFTPGITDQTFTVPITDDELEEGDETVVLSLTNPSNATFGAVNLATLTIVDDDGAGFLIYLPFVLHNYP